MDRHLRTGKKSLSKRSAKHLAKAETQAPALAPNESQGALFLKLEQDPYFRTGYMYHMSGNLGAAAACYSRSIQSSPSAEAHTHLGSVLAMMGELEGAINHARKALELNPESGDAWNELGSYLLEKHSYEEAVDAFQKALNARTCSSRSLVYFNLSRAYVCKGMLLAAQTALDECIKLDPYFDRAQFMKGQLGRQLN